MGFLTRAVLLLSTFQLILSSDVVTLTSKNFKEVTSGEENMLVEFYAPWYASQCVLAVSPIHAPCGKSDRVSCVTSMPKAAALAFTKQPVPMVRTHKNLPSWGWLGSESGSESWFVDVRRGCCVWPTVKCLGVEHFNSTTHTDFFGTSCGPTNRSFPPTVWVMCGRVHVSWAQGMQRSGDQSGDRGRAFPASLSLAEVARSGPVL